jgi:hypothetical protein
MEYKKVFEKFAGQDGFIKTTTTPQIDGKQKAALNRKGNMLFNAGDIEGARRIFFATGYSDGISRVGDHYRNTNRPVDALKMYWAAPDHTKLSPLLAQLAEILHILINEEEGLFDD